MLIQTTLVAMTVYLAVHHLTSHGSQNDRPDRPAEPSRPLAHSGINDEMYRRRFM